MAQKCLQKLKEIKKEYAAKQKKEEAEKKESETQAASAGIPKVESKSEG